MLIAPVRVATTISCGAGAPSASRTHRIVRGANNNIEKRSIHSHWWAAKSINYHHGSVA
jgi:hypothetical protein